MTNFINVKAAPVNPPSEKEAIHWLMGAYREAGFPRQRIISKSVDISHAPGWCIWMDEYDRINRGWAMRVTIKMWYWTIVWDYGVEFYDSWITKVPEKDGQRYEPRGSVVNIYKDRCDLPMPDIFSWQYSDFDRLEKAAQDMNDSEVVFIRADDYMTYAESFRKPRYFDEDGNPIKVIHAWAVPKKVFLSGLINHFNDAHYFMVKCPQGLNIYSCNYEYINYGVIDKRSMLKVTEPDFKKWDGKPSFGAEVCWGSSYDSLMDMWAPPDEPNPQDKAHVNTGFPDTQIMFAERPPKSVKFIRFKEYT
jgi:hypothetical protein